MGCRFKAPHNDKGCPLGSYSTTLKGLSRTMISAPCCTASLDALGLGIASIRHGDIACPQCAMLERFARVDIADEHLDKLQSPEVHRDMEAIVCSFSPWGLNTATVDDHKAQPLGQGIHGGHGEHAAAAELSPTDHRHASAPPLIGLS